MQTIQFTQATHAGDAQTACAAIRARRGVAHVVTCRDFSELRIIYDADRYVSAVDAHIGSLAHATLEPLTNEPASAGGHVVLDARNADTWGINHGR